MRKHDITESETLVYRFCVSREDAELVIKFVAEDCYSHEEFQNHLKELNLKNYPPSQLDRAS